jgi:hypothetical protein
MKMVLCAGHGDIEQSTFFLDLRRGANTEVRRHAAIHSVKQINGFPLLAFCGVDRGQDEVVRFQLKEPFVSGTIGSMVGLQKGVPARPSESLWANLKK